MKKGNLKDNARVIAVALFCLCCTVPQSRLYSAEQAKPGQAASGRPGGAVPSGQLGPRLSGPPSPSDKVAWDRYVQEGWDSPFGLDYIFPLDAKYRDAQVTRKFGEVTAVRWVNFARVNWGDIEKRKPAGAKPMSETTSDVSVAGSSTTSGKDQAE